MHHENDGWLSPCYALLASALTLVLASFTFQLAPGYFDVVTHPIDIKTIKSKIKTKVYKNREEFTDDCKRMFSNCRAYNDSTTEYYQCADTLEAFLVALLL
eukprot:m.85928 g.85928  ORF g.85928 m.85928 type:complete len:101 (-) comp12793_c0_seq4:299-601(-)